MCIIVIISFNTKNFRVQLHRYSVSHCFPYLVTMSLGILRIFIEICGFWLIVLEYLLWHRNLHCDDCYHHQESYADTFYVSYVSFLTSETILWRNRFRLAIHICIPVSSVYLPLYHLLVHKSFHCSDFVGPE